MSTEYRIRFENNEVVISTRQLVSPPAARDTKSKGDEGVSLGPSFPTTGQQQEPATPGNLVGAGEPSPAEVGGNGGGMWSAGGITIVFGAVNYYCGGSSDLGAGEGSSAEVGGSRAES